MSAGDVLLLDDLLQPGRRADADGVAAAEAGHDRTRAVQRRAEIARQRGAVERGRGAKSLGGHHQCELAAHAEAGDADGAGRLRHGEQVIAGGQDVVERTAALGQQLAEDTRDAAGPAAAREHVRRDGDVSRCGDPTRDRLVVRPVAERVMDQHHPRPWPLAVGNTQQRIDRSVRGVDRDGLHAHNLAVTTARRRGARWDQSRRSPLSTWPSSVIASAVGGLLVVGARDVHRCFAEGAVEEDGKGSGGPRRDPPCLHRPADGDLHHFQHRSLHAAHAFPTHRGQRVEKHDPLQPRLETFLQECPTAGLERIPGIRLDA